MKRNAEAKEQRDKEALDEGIGQEGVNSQKRVLRRVEVKNQNGANGQDGRNSNQEYDDNLNKENQ